MGMTDTGKDFISKLIGNSGTVIDWVAIGTGSAAVSASRSGLITESDRNTLTATDNSVVNETTFTADFTSVDMSGTTLTELGASHLVSGGKLWNVEGFAGVEFDGTNELQIEVQFQIF